MGQVSQRKGPGTGTHGSALVRLLSRLTDDRNGKDIGASAAPGVADRLSSWVGWTDAILLSTALNGSPETASSGLRSAAKVTSAEERECSRVRGALVKAMEAPAPAELMDPASDFKPHRRHYLARQQAMEAGIGPLRERLRAALAAGSPAMARLAAVDEVMAQVLDVREHSLLATVPAALEKHFERLRQAAQVPDAEDNEARPDAWLDVFHKDTRDVLLAELDFRFQPIEGLLEALRTRQQVT